MQGMAFEDLAKLIEPCLSEEFLASTWGKSYRYVRGWPGKFGHLLPWDDLNEVLKAHRLDSPRLRLMQDGKSLPTSTYMRHVGGGKRKSSIPRLSQVELSNKLRDGATLVLDAVDELFEPIRFLAEGLERVFHEHVQVNCYAGWRVSRGFDLHWDDHDVFILQVNGRKRWNIYGMTTPYPRTRDDESILKPTHDPIWSEVLEDGDLLYIPRGWWHVAVPLDEPTLHLTVGIHNRTGIDFLKWLSERLNTNADYRQDLPRFSSPAERVQHMDHLRRHLLETWNDDLLRDYYSELDAMAEPRSSFSLPWSATAEAIPTASDTLLRLNSPRQIYLEVKDGTVEFSCNKKRWRFAENALVVLQPLVERNMCSISELCGAAKDVLDDQTVRVFLRELLIHGLIVIVQR